MLTTYRLIGAKLGVFQETGFVCCPLPVIGVRNSTQAIRSLDKVVFLCYRAHRIDQYTTTESAFDGRYPRAALFLQHMDVHLGSFHIQPFTTQEAAVPHVQIGVQTFPCFMPARQQPANSKTPGYEATGTIPTAEGIRDHNGRPRMAHGH